MLDAKEIDIEIARLEYMESSYSNYAKLADLYTIRNQMKQSSNEDSSYDSGYSFSPPDVINRYGDSEFLASIEGKNKEDVFSIMDDLMDTLHVTNPRVYNSIIRRINSI